MANFKVDENNNITRTSSSSKKGKATFSVSENGNIKRNKVEKKQKNGFFQGSKYFDDGYDFGDILKTTFWSGADLLQDVTRGFSRTIEGTTDTLGYLSADVLDFFGADDTADWLRDVSKYDVTGNLIKDSNYLEQRSVFGNYSDTVFEGVGNVGAMALTAGVTGGGVPSTVFSSFSSSYGNTMSEALRNGEDLSTARKAAFINGTSEAISEQFFSGLPGLKTENWGGKLLGKIGSGVEKYFGTNTGKLAMKILNASGEGFEEIISNMLTSAGNDLMHKFDKNFTYGMEGQTGNILEDVKRAATSKESWNSFISAALTSALTNGGNQFISNTQKNKLIKSYAQENNMTVSQVKQAFNQSVQQKTQSEILKQPNMNLGQRVDAENLAKAQTMSELKRGTFVQPGTETQKYQYKETDNQKVNEMNKSLAEVGNNTQVNREAAATAERLIRDLGFEIEFTNNEKLQAQNQNFKGKNINGFVKDGKMYLNIDSNELANFTIGHETKHFFEANEELNNALNQSLKEYAQEKGIWDKRLAEVTDLYTDENGKLVGDPETELLADLTGEVFSNYEFVNNLSVKNPSLFEKVRDFFQKLYYKATGQREKLLIKNINDNLNRAYREYSKTQPRQEGTQYSLGTHYGDLGKARDTNFFAIDSSRRSTGHFGNGTYFVSQEESNRLNNDETFTRKARPQSEIEFDDYNLYKPKIESEGFRLHDGLKAVNYGEYDSADFEMLKNDLMRNGISEEQINNAINEVERIRQELKNADYKKQVEADSLSTEFMKALGFNGIDVRGLEGLDNTGYGSVIYDLDNKINSEKTLTKDSRGRELSKQQQEFYKNDKLVDENNNLKVYYHGSPNIFNIFDENKIGEQTHNKGLFGKGFYFTENEALADSYDWSEDKTGKTYEVYLNATNPFYWNNIKTEEQMNNLIKDLKLEKGVLEWNRYQQEMHVLTTEEQSEKFTQALKNAGYDGVVYRYDKGNSKTSETVVFNPNQIKNVDNTNPTTNPDIRYSLSVKDNNTGVDSEDYTLSKNQQKYFENSKVVDEDGNLMAVYHTTTDNVLPFYEFNPVGTKGYKFGDKVVNFYTNSIEMSDSYAQFDGDWQSNAERVSSKTNNTKEGKYQYRGYLNITNPYVFDAQESNWNELKLDTKPEAIQKIKNMDENTKNILLKEYNLIKEEYDKKENKLQELYDKQNKIRDSLWAGLYRTDPDYIKLQNQIDKYKAENEQFDKKYYDIFNKVNFVEEQFTKNTKDILKQLQNEGYKLDEKSLYNIVHSNFNDFAIKNNLEQNYETNDLVKRVLELNEKGSNYDGIIIKNVADWADESDMIAQYYNDVYVTFNSNQFKLADNKTPTSSQDIRYSLSNNNEDKIILSDGRTYNNYYDFAKDITKNNEDFAKELLFKNYTYNFNVPTNENETTFFHGTDSIYNYDDFKIMDFDEQTMDRNYGDYFYITPDKGIANEYGKQTAQFIIPNDKIMSLEEYRNTNKTDEELFKDYWAIEMPDNEYIVNDPKKIIEYSKQKAQDYINQNENPTEDSDIRYSLSEDRKNIEQQYDDIRNQRDDLRTELFELRQQRNEIINNIPDYSMFKQYDELTDINRLLDENKQKSIELYEQEKQLEEQLKKVKEKEKQQEIKKINKKTTPFKDKQFALLQKTNPMLDDYHTGIRQPGEIRTWEEAMYDAEQDGDGYAWGDFSKEDAEKALKNKSITIYSSYPIKNGVFVTPSYAQAQMYAGGEGNQVYSKTVNPDSVAWIDVDEGQYANVGRNTYEPVFSLSQEGEVQSDKYKDLFPGMARTTTRLSDLKRKEVEIPTEEENALKTAENEQKQGEKPTRREVIDKNRQLAREQLGDITQIKDKKRGFLYQINTMKRNLRDIMSKEQAQKMYDTYFKNITENNAKIENEITSYNERIQKYNLNDKESTYTQMIGELKHNPETTLTKEDVDNFYYKNASKIDQQKCEQAVEEFRNIYDELIVKINDVLTDNGYKPIDYRKGYFPHFIEEKATSKLGKLAEKLGWKVQKGQLPTDIAGITDQFKPGKAWTSFSQQRTGDATDYNALKGLDNYLRGAMDIVYHTNDIQKLRALENEIRYQYSSKGIQEKIDNIYSDDNLDMEEKNDAIANLTANMRGTGLGNFVTEIRNYTDNLANKKSFSDRSMEQAFGRDVYSIMNNINGRVSANMVGANISSAITNFIPITQAWGNMSTKNLLRGMYDSIKTSIKGDNFADKSTFLTNRTKQADRLYNSKLEKINKKLGIPFEAIDSFTANTIVRGKYYDNIAKGMSEQEAIANADEFAKDVMAGRSKGDQPTMFNKKNPLVKLFTAFQLEVNNQYGYMFKDIPTNLADEAKDKLVGAFIKIFLGAWLYNEITEKFTGRRAAFDPIDMAISDVKTLTDENMDFGDKIQSIVKDTSQELPFVSGVMGGGRLPIQGAIPYSSPLEMVTSTLEDIGKLDDPEKRKTAINNLKKEWSKPLYYVAMPFAGGQLKKTVEGLSMYDKDLPIAGSYTNSGKLRFEADTSALGKAQAAVFGQYASKNAREYFEKGYTPLTEGQVEEALDADLPIKEYREINQGIKNAKAMAKAEGENQTEAMYDYIYDLPLSMEQKNSLINSRTKGESTVKDKNGYIKYEDDKGKTYWYDKNNDTLYNNKYKVINTKDVSDLTKVSTKKDISDYGKYGSLAEFNYSNNNPDKYLALTQITDYDTYNKYKDDISAIKQNYDNQPTEVRKRAVFEYINSLPLSIEQKLMLQKMAGGYSIKSYRNQMFNYINSLNLTKEEKESIDKVLFD